MSKNLKEKFDDLKMTREEIERFTEAMKKEEFRKLLVEYAEEISDPKNRELYEQEITKLEEERGMNVTFIHPEPGYCIKTVQDGSKKCFINICKNSNIEKPSSKRDVNNNTNKSGLFWQIPHTVSPPREDMDNSGKQKCIVYDVVFHPDAYRMGETNQRFNQLLKDSAVETIEKNFNVKLDKANMKVLKNLTFKGKPSASVIRKKLEDNSNKENKPIVNSEDDPIGNIVDQLKKEYLEKQLKEKEVKKEVKKEEKVQVEEQDSKYTKPNYKIVYRGQADMQDYALGLDSSVVSSTRPKEMQISIELPLCKSSGSVNLDIFEKRLYLESNDPFYKLDLNLSYPVNENEAKAKFDKSKRCLNVTLPIIPFVAKIEQAENIIHEEEEKESEQEEQKQEFIPSSPSTSSLSSSSDIKYNLPSKFELVEYKNMLSIKLKIACYEKDSIKVNFESNTLLKIECDSTSSGGYTQYYMAYFKLPELKLNKKFEIIDLNEDSFELRLLKSDEIKEDLSNKVLVYIEEGSQEISIEINQENLEKEKEECVQVNEMSKKDYILNFDKISNTENDEDDEDDEQEQSKLIEKIRNKHKPIFDLELKEKIEEEQEQDLEKDYLEEAKKDESEDESADEEENKEKSNEHSAKPDQSSSLSSSTTDFSNESSALSSSLNSSSMSKLKGILKKPRSYSESESSFMNYNSSTDLHSGNDSQGDLTSSKKTVSFNKQVVKNVFKPGSTISGMKKPNASKNKKKQAKRKRTVSDPSHDADRADRDENSMSLLRQRSLSESSDDCSGVLSTSPGESSDVNKFLNDSKPNEASKNSKKEKKKNANNKSEETKEKKSFDMETMLEWKAKGTMPNDSNNNNVTKCGINFKNKIINDLD